MFSKNDNFQIQTFARSVACAALLTHCRHVLGSATRSRTDLIKIGDEIEQLKDVLRFDNTYVF